MSVPVVDAFKIPRASDDLLIGFVCARPRIQKDERLHVDSFARQELAFLLQWIRCNPNAVLQISKSFITQIAPKPPALGVFTHGQVKKNHSPLPVPGSRPALLGIAA